MRNGGLQSIYKNIFLINRQTHVKYWQNFYTKQCFRRRDDICMKISKTEHELNDGLQSIDKKK